MAFIKRNDGVTNVSSGYYISDLDGIYAIGVVNDEVNESRYKYTYPVKEKEIVINTYLSEQYRKNIDDMITVYGQEFTVKEILTEDTFTVNKMAMLIMDISELHKLTGNPDTEMINYVLLQCEEDKDITVITKSLENYSESFNVSCVEADEDLQKLLIAFKGMIIVLFVIVIIISGMFIASMFYEYMRKYRRDMAVMRTIGGKRKQINIIFLAMSLMVSFAGCMAGALACILFDKILLNIINKKLNMFSGSIVINQGVLIWMTAAVFVLFNIFVMIFFIARQNVLPIQVFRTTGTGLRKRKNRLRFLGIRKLTGTDFYLGIKLLIPKFWQNFMFIFIIALITALSYTGQSSMKLMVENSYHYYRNMMEGFDAYGEIDSGEEWLEPDRIIEMKEELKEASVQCCTIIGPFMERIKEAYSEYYRVTAEDIYVTDDITEFMTAFQGEYMKNWSDIPEGQRMVVSDETAENQGYKIGDKVTLDTCWLDEQKEFTVAGIVKLHIPGMNLHGIILNIGNLAYTKEKSEKNRTPNDAYFYMNGKREQLEEVLTQLEQEEENFKWFNLEQIVEEGNTITAQRMTMIRMVMIFLAIVAGIGWLNSAKGLLLARKEEYKVLRMLGATRKNVRKISWIQVWSYMLSGIILGIVMGLTTVYLFWRNEVHENVTISIYWENIAGIALFLFALSLLLKPTIKKLAL